MVGHLFQNYDTIYVRFLPRILAFFLALWGFYSQVYGHFLTNAHIQLFRERLSEKVHATIPKGIVGGFKFTVL